MDSNLLSAFAKVSAVGFLFGLFAAGSSNWDPDVLSLSGLLALVASMLVLFELMRLDPNSLPLEPQADALRDGS